MCDWSALRIADGGGRQRLSNIVLSLHYRNQEPLFK